MNNIRKIIEERLDNARNDYEQVWSGTTIYDILQGQIDAYQDCLNLIPTPRTEKDILNDFEKLGYQIVVNSEDELDLRYQIVDGWYGIRIYKYIKSYEPYLIIKAEKRPIEINMQEHKLLNELFEVIFNEC